MKVTFPYMSNSHITIKNLLEGLGNEVISPPKPSKLTLSYGTKYAPEFACVPFKITLGTYIETLEMGADTIVSTGGVGPCRAGLYTTLQEKILRNIGYEFDMITFEPPGKHLKDIIHNFKKLVNKKVSLVELIRLVRFVWNQLILLDEVESESLKIRPCEVKQGETTRAYRKIVNIIAETKTRDDLKEARKLADKIYAGVDRYEDADPLKVVLLGEIYVVMEPTANLEIEETLGELGVYVERTMFFTHYTINNAVTDLFHLTGDRDAKKAAAPYFNEMCGGHGRESVGNTVLYAEKGFDGVIQVAPFTCIPEIVAKSILPSVTEKYGMGFLSISIDEQTGKAGLQTRLEAFVDLLARNREKKRKEKIA